MKKTKIIIGLFALLFAVTSIQAQESGTGDISIGYGFYSSNQLGVAFIDFFGIVGSEIFADGRYGRENYRDIGPISFSLKLTPHNRFTIGGIIMYENIDSDLTLYGDIGGHQQIDFLTAALEFDYRYVSKESFQMYFTLGAGASIGYETYTPHEMDTESSSSSGVGYGPYPNFHANLLGFRFGRKAAVFAEFGLGYKGIANVGFSFQMN